MALSKDFIWGAAVASYQVEGAWNEDGKGPSIWDTYSHARQSPIRHHDTGDVACDLYHHFKEDVALMKEIGLQAFRFSISWSRIIPDGFGEVNAKGLQFYSDLVDELLANGIEPMITLYHWDLPQAVFDRGGWMNPDIVEWFARYTKIVIDALSDRVKYWITINEPQIFIGLGCYTGVHAPFLKMSDRDILLMSRHVLLAHGRAVRIIRECAKQPSKVGFAPTGPTFIPENDSAEAIETAREKSFAFDKDGYPFSNSWWADPIFLRKFPDGAKAFFGDLIPEFSEEEWDIVSSPLDFYGCNIYNAMRDASDISATDAKNGLAGEPINAINWPITPDALYWSAKFFYERYHLPILITENGFANTDFVHLDGKVHDPQRIDYTQRYLRGYYRASEDGIPLFGYIYWSFMDNFEWGIGYDARFGLVHVNYQTQVRTLKDSAYWYRDIIASNGEKLWE